MNGQIEGSHSMYMLSIQIDTKSFELFNNIKLSNFASDMKGSLFCILITGTELKQPQQHFWHSVYGNLGSTVPGELMSKAITSDYIRTNGMPQSDKENNAANRLQEETNRNEEEEAGSSFRRKRFEK